MSWSKKYNACTECSSSENPHLARGLCNKCYKRIWARTKAKEKPARSELFTKESLTALYVDQRLTTKEIGAIKGVTKTTVQNWLKSYEITTRRNVISQSQFIERCQERWGDKYDLSVTKYLAAKKHIYVICPKKNHGKFRIETAENFSLGKSQCPKCQERQKLTFDRFLKLAKEVHPTGYEYQPIDNINYHDIIIIKCLSHGGFPQAVGSHLSGVGCPDCANVVRAAKMRKSKEAVIKSFRKIHGSAYDYSMMDYVNNETEITIVCKHHGEYNQLPTNHLSGKGCIQCGYSEVAKKQSGNLENFLAEAFEVWGDMYDYSKTQYVSAKEHVIIVCKEHGEFEKTPDKHIRGQGCPGCAEYGFDQTKSATLYYLKIDMGWNCSPIYKIGITNRSVHMRFPSQEDRQKIHIIKTWEFQSGREAYLKEQEILQQYKHASYSGGNVLVGHGNTEMFQYDILRLDVDLKT